MARQSTEDAKTSALQSPVVAEAMSRFKEAESAESPIRKEALTDLRFWTGDGQWPEEVKSARANESRPCLTINLISDVVSKVVNEQRQEQPGIEVDPIGSGADVATAQILEGLARHIQNRSDASFAYENGYQWAVVTGLGYWRVRTDYSDDESFNQDILIEPIRNRFSVYYDPYCEAPDWSDARFAFITQDLSKDEYKARYPDSKLASFEASGAMGNMPRGWASKDGIRIAEYWHVIETPIEIDVDGRKRRVMSRKVVCDKINAIEVLEHWDWPGTIIPIVPCVVFDVDVDGKRRIWGLVRNARDPQTQYNYMRSAETEAIALAPKAPYIVAEGQIEGHEKKWKTANLKNWPVLEYKPVSVAGQPAPPPQRNGAEPPIQAIAQAVAQSEGDLRAVTGLYEPSLGQQGPEQSARAILARQNQGGVATLAYTSAMARAIKLTGRILLEIIPKVYDVPRVEKIINPDGSARHVALFNSKESDMDQQQAMEALQEEKQAIERIYDVGTGKYDVTVDVGPSYQSKRQEAVASMMTLINSFPQIVPVAGDIIARNMDWPGSEELAERLAKMLPPQLQNQGDPRQQAAQMAGQLQQLTQVNQALTQQLQAAMATIESRQVESASREKIAQLQAETQIVVQELKSKLAEAQARADAELAMVTNAQQFAHERGMQAVESMNQPQATQQ